MHNQTMPTDITCRRCHAKPGAMCIDQRTHRTKATSHAIRISDFARGIVPTPEPERLPPQGEVIGGQLSLEFKPAKINVAKLCGRSGRAFRYTSTAKLLEWRKEVRSELNTAKRLRNLVKGDKLREQRQHEVWRLIGQLACITTVLRARLADPEDLTWQQYSDLLE